MVDLQLIMIKRVLLVILKKLKNKIPLQQFRLSNKINIYENFYLCKKNLSKSSNFIDFFKQLQ